LATILTAQRKEQKSESSISLESIRSLFSFSWRLIIDCCQGKMIKKNWLRDGQEMKYKKERN